MAIQPMIQPVIRSSSPTLCPARGGYRVGLAIGSHGTRGRSKPATISMRMVCLIAATAVTCKASLINWITFATWA